jgi:hypothetical protein
LSVTTGGLPLNLRANSMSTLTACWMLWYATHCQYDGSLLR